MRGPPASFTVFQPIPKPLPARSLMTRGADSSPRAAGELREVVLDPERRAELESEFAPDIGMNEIVAPLLHREEIALASGVPQQVKGDKHIELMIMIPRRRRRARRSAGAPQRRQVGLLDRSAVAVEAVGAHRSAARGLNAALK